MGVLSRLSKGQQCRIDRVLFSSLLLPKTPVSCLTRATGFPLFSTMRIAFMVCCLLAFSFALPAPQATNTLAQPKTDGDQQNLNGVTEILKFGASLVEGFIALMGQKVTFLSKLLSDQEFQESIGGTVDAAVNLTGTVARVAIPVAQGVLESVPTLVTQGSRFAGSVVRASNDTSPLLLEGIAEFTDQLPLIADFASAYAEVNAEQSQIVAETFSRSLTCNLECQEATSVKEREECEKKYCKKVEESGES